MRTNLSVADLGDLLDRPLVATLATYPRKGEVLLSPVWFEWLANDQPAEQITSALWSACHGGQRATAELLLQHGADLNWGRTVGRAHLAGRRPPQQRRPARRLARRTGRATVRQPETGVSALDPTAGPEFPACATNPPLPVSDGPVDPTVPPEPVEGVDRPARFTLMAPGWMPPREMVTQALGICFTGDGLVVMVTWDGLQWTFPGGTVEDGETIQHALVREVAEEACARVVHCQYLACQHVADPLNPNGGPSYYQTRWWARVHLDPWQPRHEMIGRCLVATDRVLSTLFWPRKAHAQRLLRLALAVDQTRRR